MIVVSDKIRIMKTNNSLSPLEIEDLIETLGERFAKNDARHKGIKWADVEKRLRGDLAKLRSISEMERTGGEPDVVGKDKKSGEFIFFDCSPETPKGRRSLCYDRKAWESRKEHKPASDALTVAKEIGITILDEDEYAMLQSLGPVDVKTSSWIATPDEVRTLGGALFGDCRFGRVFTYHNGAESYYAARGFRGSIRI